MRSLRDGVHFSPGAALPSRLPVVGRGVIRRCRRCAISQTAAPHQQPAVGARWQQTTQVNAACRQLLQLPWQWSRAAAASHPPGCNPRANLPMITSHRRRPPASPLWSAGQDAMPSTANASAGAELSFPTACDVADCDACSLDSSQECAQCRSGERAGRGAGARPSDGQARPCDAPRALRRLPLTSLSPSLSLGLPYIHLQATLGIATSTTSSPRGPSACPATASAATRSPARTCRAAPPAPRAAC